MAAEERVATVSPFIRPPIRQSVTVQRDIAHTFRVFVSRLGEWWPLRPFSVGEEHVAQVTVEPFSGGRVFETWQDGTERQWATVDEWDEPHRFTLSWELTGVPTEVILTFSASSPSSTLVQVEHRGWDRLSDEDLARDCALPGGYDGGSFTEGWSRILARFLLAAESFEEGSDHVADR